MLQRQTDENKRELTQGKENLLNRNTKESEKERVINEQGQ